MPFKKQVRMPEQLGAYSDWRDQYSNYRDVVTAVGSEYDLPPTLKSHYREYVRHFKFDQEQQRHYKREILSDYKEKFAQEAEKVKSDPNELGRLAALEPQISSVHSSLKKFTPGTSEWQKQRKEWDRLTMTYRQWYDYFSGDSQISQSKEFRRISGKALRLLEGLDAQEAELRAKEARTSRVARENRTRQEQEAGKSKRAAEKKQSEQEKKSKAAAQKVRKQFDQARDAVLELVRKLEISSSQEKEWDRARKGYEQAREEARIREVLTEDDRRRDRKLMQDISKQTQNMSYLVYTRGIYDRFCAKAMKANFITPKAGDIEHLNGLLNEYKEYQSYLTVAARERRAEAVAYMEATVKKLKDGKYTGRMANPEGAPANFQASAYVEDPVEKYYTEIKDKIITQPRNVRYEGEDANISLECAGKQYCFPPRSATANTPASKFVWFDNNSGQMWLAVSDDESANWWISGVVLDYTSGEVNAQEAVVDSKAEI
ncbi:hypothetical protein [Streptomyces sp. NPDC126514]|uniref:hypothetical protein n=1 Tax=Streptomyces sp. NPDC126514 TaxID=3155210 RepID=UPI0033255B1A